MRTLKGLSDTITGILTESSETPREQANHIIEFLFEEDNLVVPPKQDYDLRLKMYADFYEWHKEKGFITMKRDDFQEWLWTL
tara:strand:- start:329 stop:574 length:246 start_codon:yes stop_codon:yes gene_type:complete